MNDLHEAQDRLDKALARLEKAASGPGRGGARTGRLQDELEMARRRCDVLEDRTREVSERLDAAITRIRSLLED